jgi:shikimate kinase
LQKNNIVLVGFMLVGKSTVGRRLASEMGWAFVDSDHQIEQSEGMSIAEIFEQRGEPYFREAESEMIANIMRGQSQIVSTGGGAVLAEKNRDVLMAGGFVVALKASRQTLVDRARGDIARPLLGGDAEEKIDRLLEQRKDAYEFAELKIDTDYKSVDQIVVEILARYRGDGLR